MFTPSSKNCIFYPNKIIYPLLLPSHNCIIIISLCSVFKVHVVEIKSTISHFTQASNACLCLCFSSSIQTRLRWALNGAWVPFPRNSMKLQFLETSVNFLVEISGIEPLTSCLQGRRSPSWAKPPYCFEVVGQNGLEPSTSRLSVVCSSQLSYWPISASTVFLGTSFPVPSKLNNAQNLRNTFLTLGRYK